MAGVDSYLSIAEYQISAITNYADQPNLVEEQQCGRIDGNR